jgi:hypothetical protein
VANAERFRNEAGLAKLAVNWPSARLVEIRAWDQRSDLGLPWEAASEKKTPSAPSGFLARRPNIFVSTLLLNEDRDSHERGRDESPTFALIL